MSSIERKIVAVFQEGLPKSQGSYKDMVHGATTKDVQQGLQRMSKACGVLKPLHTGYYKGTQKSTTDIYYTAVNSKN